MTPDLRSDLLRRLLRAHVRGDEDTFRLVANEIVSEEERLNHHVLAEELRGILSERGIVPPSKAAHSTRSKESLPVPRDNEKGFPLLEVRKSYHNLDDLVLPDETKNRLLTIIDERKNSARLQNYGLAPKQRILLAGPPGTGKTLSAYVLSTALDLPLVHVKFESIVSSFLGETAANLSKVFSFVQQGQWVVLFDEFDVIGKRRDDPHEHGEIKRVVNNFIQMLDNYQTESLLVAATNHPHLLDVGLWRRFDDIITYELPNRLLRIEMFVHQVRVFKKNSEIDLEVLAAETEGFSQADIAQACQEAFRRVVLSGRDTVRQADLKEGVRRQRARRSLVEGQRGDTTG